MKRTSLIGLSIAVALAAAPLHAQTAANQTNRAMASLSEANNEIEGGAIYAAIIFLAAVIGAVLLDESGEDRTSP